MNPFWRGEGLELRLGDCSEVMRQLPAESVDAIVTDPPYGLEFMGKEWDKLLVKDRHVAYPSCRGNHGPNAYRAGLEAQAWHYSWATEAFRVLKPGGHMLAFGGTRTFHRLACAVEDAGFEIRDCLMWLYGQGFPKSLDVSKAIDKAAGTERRILGQERMPWKGSAGSVTGVHGKYRPVGEDGYCVKPITAPASDAAHQWQGWGTALKPAWEPILLCRKPLSGTVAANIQRWGTGAINVDGCRIEGANGQGHWHNNDGYGPSTGGNPERVGGRWPANLMLECTCEETREGRVRASAPASGPTLTGESISVARGKFCGVEPCCADLDGKEAVRIHTDPNCPCAMLDAQSGESKSNGGGGHRGKGQDTRAGIYGVYGERDLPSNVGKGDSGGASRFFYIAKAGRDERGGGKHPTVKPLALIRWLCRLITLPGGLILDPFIGSGTTAVAARMEGFRCIGIDQEEAYLANAVSRLTLGDRAMRQQAEAKRAEAEQPALGM